MDPFRHKGDCPGILQHETGTRCGRCRIYGQIGRTRFHDPEQSGDEIDGSLREQADQPVRSGTECPEAPGDLFRAGIERGISEGGARTGDGEAVGMLCDLGREAADQRIRDRQAALRAPCVPESRALLSADDPDPVERLFRLRIDQAAQGRGQERDDPLYAVRVEPGAVIADTDPDFVAISGRDQGQRIVGVIDRASFGEVRAAVLSCRKVRIERVILEDQQTVEQGRARCDPAVPLDTGKWDIAELAVLLMLHLQGFQPGAGRAIRRGNAHRHGVDEESDHVLDPGEIDVPAGEGDAECDFPLAAGPAQDQGPGSIEQGAERQMSRARRLDQGLAERGLESEAGFLLGAAVRVRCCAAGAGQWCRRVETGECRAPMDMGRFLILVFQPGDVVLVRRRRRKIGRAGAIEQHQVPEQDGQAPAVQQQMVEAQNELPACVIHPDEHAAEQRRLRQIEPGAAFLGQKLFESILPPRLVQHAPVQLPPWQGGCTADELKRLIALQPQGGAQDLVPFEERIPGRAEAARVERAAYLPCQLLEIDRAARRIGQAVESQAELHRAQGV